MKFTPLSTAVRTRRILPASVGLPMCEPPRPITETFSPVFPSGRQGTSAFASVAQVSFLAPATTAVAIDSLRNLRRVMLPSSPDHGDDVLIETNDNVRLSFSPIQITATTSA